MLATLAVGWLCFLIVQPFLPALMWALSFAAIARPFHQRIAARIPHPGTASAISVTLVVAILGTPLAFLSYHLAAQAAEYAQEIGRAQTSAPEGLLHTLMERHERLRPAFEWIEKHADLQRELLSSAIGSFSGATAFMGGAVWVLTQVLVTLLTLFYFFRDESQILQSVRRMLPLTMPEIESLFERIDDTIHATIYGALAVALIQGCLGGLMFWWLGLPTPLLWGIVMGLLAVIPNLGTFVIWAPAALLLALNGDFAKAGILVTWGLIAIGLIDNLLYPVLVGDRMRLHPLAIFFAMLGGLALLGASGVVVGPIVISTLLALIDVWRGRTVAGEAADQPLENAVHSTAPLRPS